jgi:hypothetical protein
MARTAAVLPQRPFFSARLACVCPVDNQLIQSMIWLHSTKVSKNHPMIIQMAQPAKVIESAFGGSRFGVALFNFKGCGDFRCPRAVNHANYTHWLIGCQTNKQGRDLWILRIVFCEIDNGLNRGNDT